MAIDRELLKHILEHYKHRLDQFLQEEGIKPVASGHFSNHINDLKRRVDEALSSLDSLKSDIDSETKSWIRSYSDILKPAVSQYEKDAKQFLAEADAKLSRPNLRLLEIELARIAAEIVTLLNL
jgi:flagellar biosynthesis chaperone FliJ